MASLSPSFSLTVSDVRDRGLRPTHSSAQGWRDLKVCRPNQVEQGGEIKDMKKALPADSGKTVAGLPINYLFL